MNPTRYDFILIATIVAFAGQASAADKWAVGVNTMFIQEYAQYLNTHGYSIPCDGCPGNVKAHSLAEIQASIHDLVVNQHVGAFREIVPFTLLSPNGQNNPSGGWVPIDGTNFWFIDQIMAIFRAYNVHLILALGNPVPAWAAPWGNGYGCFLPPASDSTNFNTFKNNVAWTMGGYLKHLKDYGFNSWMAGGPPGGGGLFIEGFNEWNGNGTPDPTPRQNAVYPFVNCDPMLPCSPDNCNDRTTSTPARAALLQGGINWVALGYYGATARMASPSIAGGTGSGWGFAEWFGQYYAAGGIGAPNIHVYPVEQYAWPAIASAQVALQYVLDEGGPGHTPLPAPYNTQIIWGETGFGEATAGVCTGPRSMNSNDWSWYNTMAAQTVTGSHGTLTSAVQLLTVWRLERLDIAQPDCEATYGIATPNLTSYHSSGQNMFNYLRMP